MRTYSNFLLFEDVLTNLPVGSTPIVAAANMLMSPTIPIVEADCGTLLGTILPVDYSAEGAMEISTGTRITMARVDYLKSIGISKVRIRNTSSCISKRGICAKCFDALISAPAFLDGSWKLDGSRLLNGNTATSLGASTPVGSMVKIPSEYQYATQVLVGDGLTSEFICSQSSLQYSRTTLLATEGSIVDGKIILNAPLAIGVRKIIHYFTTSSNPFLEYVAKSYSGGMLGISPLPSFPMALKPSVYQSLFSDSQLSLLQLELNSYVNNIPATYISYCDTIPDTLEKVLMIIYLYAIYANIN